MTKYLRIFRSKVPIFILIAFSFFLIGFFVQSITNKEEDNQYLQEFKNNYKIYSIVIPEEVEFAGEKLPLDLFDVKEALDRELLVNTYWQSQTVLFLKRANRYFPIIEPILKENGVPDDFKYLAVIESGLTNAVSPSGARGFWQFIPSTAKIYGLEVNDDIDERYNLEKATVAACNYLKESYNLYKDWALVAASYNSGKIAINNQIKKQQVDNYYDLFLNEETARYVFRIVAVKLIMSNPSEYGYSVRQKDLYPFIPTNTITVDSSITNLTDYARYLKTSYKMLKICNPWLRQTSLPNKMKKSYTIKYPVSDFREIKFNNDAIFNISQDSL